MKKLKTTDGKHYALVDSWAYDFLKRFKWYINPRRHGSYLYTSTRGKNISLHRAIMIAQKGEIVDHINHDTLDKRIENLRIVTSNQNGANRGHKPRSKSGYYGVWHDKPRGRFVAYCFHNGKNIHAGKSKSAKEAAIIRDKLAYKLWGECATLNFPKLLIKAKP